MNFHVYILQSKTTGKYYCGQTDDLAARLVRHNAGVNNYTSHGIPWEIVLSFQVNTRGEAMILEKEIKKRGIGRFLKDHQT